MARKDFYQVLGVSREATQDEIRRAYRKLARQYHPDVNKAKDAQARFTEIQVAYDALSDEQKRQRYDRYGSAEPAAAASSGRPHYSWTNVGGGPRSAGFDQSELDPETLGSMFEAFFGGRGEDAGMGRAAHGARGRARGADAETELEVPFLTAARGGTERFRVSSGGKSRTIDVTIPKGVADGAKLRVKGEGEPGGRAGRGDLIITVRIGAHPLFKREPVGGSPLDLRLDLPLSIAEATLGSEVSIPTLQGRVELTIPPGTPSGKKFRLRGRGVEDDAGRKGDLYAVTRIVTPNGTELSSLEREQLRAISKATPHLRAGDEWRTP